MDQLNESVWVNELLNLLAQLLKGIKLCGFESIGSKIHVKLTSEVSLT